MSLFGLSVCAFGVFSLVSFAFRVASLPDTSRLFHRGELRARVRPPDMSSRQCYSKRQTDKTENSGRANCVIGFCGRDCAEFREELRKQGRTALAMVSLTG